MWRRMHVPAATAPHPLRPLRAPLPPPASPLEARSPLRAPGARAWGGWRARMATYHSPLVCASASWCVPGAHTCALLINRSVQCFGSNGNGQLGLGDTTDRYTPTAVSALGTSVVRIALGGAQSPAAACACRCRARRALCVPVCVRRRPLGRVDLGAGALGAHAWAGGALVWRLTARSSCAPLRRGACQGTTRARCWTTSRSSALASTTKAVSAWATRRIDTRRPP